MKLSPRWIYTYHAVDFEALTTFCIKYYIVIPALWFMLLIGLYSLFIGPPIYNLTPEFFASLGASFVHFTENNGYIYVLLFMMFPVMVLWVFHIIFLCLWLDPINYGFHISDPWVRYTSSCWVPERPDNRIGYAVWYYCCASEGAFLRTLGL